MGWDRIGWDGMGWEGLGRDGEGWEGRDGVMSGLFLLGVPTEMAVVVTHCR